MQKKIFISIVSLLLFAIFMPVFALDLIHANSNSNRMESGAIVSTLWGNVEFLWDDTRIFSDTTVWRRGTGHLTKRGNIRVLRKNQKLTCNAVNFQANTRILNLRGSVSAIDSLHSVTMFSGRADYFLNTDSIFLSTNPRIHFWNKDSADTLTIFGKTMAYSTQTGVARAFNKVRIVGEDFIAYADTGFFFADTRTAIKFGNARILHDNSVVSGDTIHIIFDENALREFYVVSNPIAEITQINYSGNEYYTEIKDSTLTKMRGDTIRFLLENQRISQVITTNNASVIRYNSQSQEIADRMWGDKIVTTINDETQGENTTISRITGNARAIYHDGDTRNESSGDSIQLFFDSSGVSRVIISGGVSGRLIE